MHDILLMIAYTFNPKANIGIYEEVYYIIKGLFNYVQ